MFSKLFEFVAWLHGDGKTPEQVCQEWHSLLIGFAEMFCLSIPSRFPVTEVAIEEMAKEFHYYNIGRGIGFSAILFVIGSLVKWVFL